MLTTLPATHTHLLKLPVVLTPLAWQKAVHLARPSHLTDISNRLGEVILAAYKELHTHLEIRQVIFGLYRFPPLSDRSYRTWLDLRLNLVESELGSPYLRVSLKEEEPAFWP
ncbi:hypothetical protein [Pseudomonas brassicacearum]|uniref:Uncharacterized protein n=1 Tax=Pseudomonas brassicacearum TaxID=930166 RepID=A0A423GNH8_9PSED|nr:hypothetical protein [Pseudomonas brassicacearum]ROM93898.1 hypothetical protein BK658_19780 [Pseudomonas brassicacearum]